MKKSLYALFVALVYLLLAAPFVFTFICDEDEVKANQNLAKLPMVRDVDSGQINKDYLPQLSDYLSEHFAFRQDMITIYSEILSSVFSTSASDSVIVGNDGYLFYDKEIDCFTENTEITDRELFSAANNVRLMQEYVLGLGSEFYFTVAPNKSTVYPEKMPYNYIEGETKLLTAFTQYLNDLGVNYIDLKTPLIDAKESTNGSFDTIYHRLDSHWNNIGAAVGAKAILESLDVEPTDFLNMSYTSADDFQGDLYEMLYPKGTEKDTNYYFDYSSSVEVLNKLGADTFATSTDITWMTKNDRLSSDGRTLLMFRDSFGNALAPLLAEDFSSAVFKRAVPYDLSLVNSTHPDKVVIEIVERNIKNLASDAIGASALGKYPAPERVIDSAEKSDVDFVLTAETDSQTQSMLTLIGILSSEVDTTSRIYLRVDGRCYEAALCGSDPENNEKFQVNLPCESLNNLAVSVIFEKNSVLYETAVKTVDILSTDNNN